MPPSRFAPSPTSGHNSGEFADQWHGDGECFNEAAAVSAAEGNKEELSPIFGDGLIGQAAAVAD
jgi:hypothetical protein